MASSGSHQAFSSKSYSFNSFRLLRYTLYRTPPLDNSNSRCNLPHLHVFILHIIIILMFICIISFDSSPRNTSIVPVGRYFFYTDCISLCTYLVEVVGCTVGTIFIFITEVAHLFPFPALVTFTCLLNLAFMFRTIPAVALLSSPVAKISPSITIEVINLQRAISTEDIRACDRRGGGHVPNLITTLSPLFFLALVAYDQFALCTEFKIGFPLLIACIAEY